MKTQLKFILVFLILLGLAGCSKTDNKFSNISDLGLKVSFKNTKSANTQKEEFPLTYETPQNYFVALKSATLLGENGTADVLLFTEDSLKTAFVFDYTDDNTVHSLLSDASIPDGDYAGIQIEIYYLQMNISIATADRGVERRNFRIYLSDDIDYEKGMHHAGDMTQINDGQEIGWLMGEGQKPNLDPVSPRVAAYTTNGDGTSWYDFAGKPGNLFGPFGDLDFMNNAPHPIYSTTVNFDLVNNSGNTIILDFNVANCWQFEDKSGDGSFGYSDLDPLNPTRWHMALPIMTISLE